MAPLYVFQPIPRQNYTLYLYILPLISRVKQSRHTAKKAHFNRSGDRLSEKVRGV